MNSSPDTNLELTCPECGSRLVASADRAGQRIECQMCGRSLIVPGRPTTRPATGDDLEEFDDVAAESDEQVRVSPPSPSAPRRGSATAEPDEADLLGELAALPLGSRATPDPFELSTDAPLRVEGITPPDKSFRVRCPVCDTTIYATLAQVGQTKKCPDCFTLIPIKTPSTADLSSQSTGWAEADEAAPLRVEPTFERQFFDTRLIPDSELSNMRPGPELEPTIDSQRPTDRPDEPELKVANQDFTTVQPETPFEISEADSDESAAPSRGQEVRPASPRGSAATTTVSADDELRLEPETPLDAPLESGAFATADAFPGFATVHWIPGALAEPRPSPTMGPGTESRGSEPPVEPVPGTVAPSSPPVPMTAVSPAAMPAESETELPSDIGGLFRSKSGWRSWIRQIGRGIATREIILRGILLALVVGFAYAAMTFGLSFFSDTSQSLEEFPGYVLLFFAVMIGLFAVVASTVYANGIVRSAAAPDQAEDAFAELGIAEWGSAFLAVGTSLWGASIPGWVLSMMILATGGSGILAVLIIAVFAAFLSPPLMTSAFYNGSPFQLFAPVVFRTLRSHQVAWVQLYVGIAVVVAAWCLISLLLLVGSVVFGFVVAAGQVALLTLYSEMMGLHIRRLSAAMMSWDEQHR